MAKPAPIQPVIEITVSLPIDAADRLNDLAASIRKEARGYRNARLIDLAVSYEASASDLQAIVDVFPRRRRGKAK